MVEPGVGHGSVASPVSQRRWEADLPGVYGRVMTGQTKRPVADDLPNGTSLRSLAVPLPIAAALGSRSLQMITRASYATVENGPTA